MISHFICPDCNNIVDNSSAVSEWSFVDQAFITTSSDGAWCSECDREVIPTEIPSQIRIEQVRIKTSHPYIPYIGNKCLNRQFKTERDALEYAFIKEEKS